MTKYYYFIAEWDGKDGRHNIMSAVQDEEGVDHFALMENIAYTEKKYNLQSPCVYITNVIEITKEEVEKYLKWVKK